MDMKRKVVDTIIIQYIMDKSNHTMRETAAEDERGGWSADVTNINSADVTNINSADITNINRLIHSRNKCYFFSNTPILFPCN